MKFSQLNAFKVIVECQTITAAAHQLNLSQPAVSRLLVSLEQHLGFPLFTRQKNRLQLNRQGEAFYLEACKVVEAMTGLDDAVDSLRSKGFGAIDIAAMPLLSHSFLPRVISLLLKESSQLKVGFKSYRSEEVLRRVQSQSIDLGFAFSDAVVAGVKTQTLSSECVCLLPKNHP